MRAYGGRYQCNCDGLLMQDSAVTRNNSDASYSYFAGKTSARSPHRRFVDNNDFVVLLALTSARFSRRWPHCRWNIPPSCVCAGFAAESIQYLRDEKLWSEQSASAVQISARIPIYDLLFGSHLRRGQTDRMARRVRRHRRDHPLLFRGLTLNACSGREPPTGRSSADYARYRYAARLTIRVTKIGMSRHTLARLRRRPVSISGLICAGALG